MAQLRQTAAALEGLLGRDRHRQTTQTEILAQLKLLEVETQTGLGGLEKLWCRLDAQVHVHPEAFQESLQRLLPDLSKSGIAFITVEGTLGGGLLAATALNALVGALIEKPDCHCYLGK